MSSASLAATTPDIQFDETICNFGTIGQEEKLTHVFKFRNVGGGELTIEKVRSSCSCAATLLSSQQIPPQGTGEIKVTFNSEGYVGKINKSIFVHSNDPAEPVVKLGIKAMVQPIAYIRPKQLFFHVRKGETETKTLKVFPHEKGLK
jgi:hypothetical protein